MASVEEGKAEMMTAVVKENARIMSLDKVCTKLMVEIKKLHCPDSPSASLQPNVQKELNLVDGDDDDDGTKGGAAAAA